MTFLNFIFLFNSVTFRSTFWKCYSNNQHKTPQNKYTNNTSPILTVDTGKANPLHFENNAKAAVHEGQRTTGSDNMEQQWEENAAKWRLLSQAVDKLMFYIITAGLALGIVIIALIIAVVA